MCRRFTVEPANLVIKWIAHQLNSKLPRLVARTHTSARTCARAHTHSHPPRSSLVETATDATNRAHRVAPSTTTTTTTTTTTAALPPPPSIDHTKHHRSGELPTKAAFADMSKGMERAADKARKSAVHHAPADDRSFDKVC
jgi:hypothetical protein